MSLSRANAMRLAEHAMKEGAVALRGHLKRGEDSHLRLDGHSVTEWLGQYEGSELIILVATMEAAQSEHTRQCSACGRDYQGVECPHCAAARARLRGHA